MERASIVAVGLLCCGLAFGLGVLTGWSTSGATKGSAAGRLFDAVRRERNTPRADGPNLTHPERREQFAEYAGAADVVMLGDSITHFGLWDEMFPEVVILNRGIASDKIYDILHRSKNIAAVNPKKIFVMAGINDILSGRNLESAQQDYARLLEQLKASGATVYVQSTLLVATHPTFAGGAETNASIRALDKWLERYTQANSLEYVDINAFLADESGGLAPAYTQDGVHLSGAGYAAWKRVIAPYIRQ